jgi:GAF domain-containing protein
MKRRSKAGGEPLKGRRPKTLEPKRPSAAKARVPANSSPSGNEAVVARLTQERDAALEQQTATSEVLRVISASRGELEPVFQMMLERAIRICEAKFVALYRFNGNAFHVAAQVGASKELADFRRLRGPFRPTSGGLLDRVLQTKRVNYIADQADEPSGPAAKLGGARSVVCVPMLKDDVLVGVITIYRQEVRPFTDRQIELVQNFAAQAVIAIENARLLNELRQRTTDLTEALEQQTATSEVLSIISSSRSELDPVFRSMLQNAARLCEAELGTMYFREGDAFRVVAMYGAPPAFVKALFNSVVYPGANTALGCAMQTKQAAQIEDVTASPAYTEGDPRIVSSVELAGVRTVLSVPMLKDNEVVGAIAIYRKTVRSFTKRHIGLVTNFAAQAVIAIENARLLNELRQRTADLTERTTDLTEALEQQTATSEVLQVISSSRRPPACVCNHAGRSHLRRQIWNYLPLGR